jgi:2-dehydropantoate 2-reductase
MGIAWVVTMKVLIVGSGVIGTVYGAHLAVAGHAVSVLGHPARTDEVVARGLRARDAISGDLTEAAVSVVPAIGADRYDLVLVTVRADQVAAACARLDGLAGGPTVLLFGNNSGGRNTAGVALGGRIRQGFPGVGGVLQEGVARYVRISQQPTALEAGSDPRLAELEQTLRGRGFAVRRVGDMDGWLVYHAAFVACVAAALLRCGTDPGRLAADRPAIRLMCAAITEAFGALRRSGVRGRPRNLAVLHHPLLRPVAIGYWTRTMRSPMGELWFAAHCRHAQAEMRALGAQVLARIGDSPRTARVRLLLQAHPDSRITPGS